MQRRAREAPPDVRGDRRVAGRGLHEHRRPALQRPLRRSASRRSRTSRSRTSRSKYFDREPAADDRAAAGGVRRRRRAAEGGGPAPPRPRRRRRPAAENPASDVKRVELPDGTILLTKRISTSPLVVMHMYALGGLTAEDAKTNGIGNLTMQMLPRGTKTRTAQQIAEFFDSIGGDLETACGNNSWSWTATLPEGRLRQGVRGLRRRREQPGVPRGRAGDDEAARRSPQIAEPGRRLDGAGVPVLQEEVLRPDRTRRTSSWRSGRRRTSQRSTREQLREWYDEEGPPGRRVHRDLRRRRSGEGGGARARSMLGTRPTVEARSPTTPIAGTRQSPAATADGTPSVEVERVEMQKTEQPLAGVVIGFDAEQRHRRRRPTSRSPSPTR